MEDSPQRKSFMLMGGLMAGKADRMWNNCLSTLDEDFQRDRETPSKPTPCITERSSHVTLQMRNYRDSGSN